MPSFSLTSRQELETCDPKLRALFSEVIKHFDCTIVEGARTDAKQKLYFESGRSKLDGVTRKSKHQTSEEAPLSRAVDVAPYYADEYPRIPWDANAENARRWFYFAGKVVGIAESMGLLVTWGGDWDSDDKFTDQSFHDWPHFELDDV